ncbi:MAG: hypothetical protein GYA23_04420 [Methanomicrobiales archaeon]|nr:hypothetical protein [Methanomicrobiales archaeon]
MRIQQDQYENMEPASDVEPYTLPLTMRITYGPFILLTVFIFLPLVAGPVYLAAFADPPDNIGVSMICFVILAGFFLFYLNGIMQEIRLTEEMMCYREWFFWKELEFKTITAARISFRPTEIGNLPVLELSRDSGPTISISFSPFDSPKNRFVIYDVLKKKATRAGIYKSWEEFFTDPDANPKIKDLLPQPYTLPLTLPKNKSDFKTIVIIFLLIILPGSLLFTIFPGPIGWVVCFLLIAGYWLGYYFVIRSGWKIRLCEDRICYQERSSRKEMEYQRITGVRYYRQETGLEEGLEQVLELTGDNGDTITISFGTSPNPESLGILYDVLKKKAPGANLGNSPGVFFYHPDGTAGR